MFSMAYIIRSSLRTSIKLRNVPQIDINGAESCEGTNLHGPTSTFIAKEGGVTDADLADTNLVKIVQEETTDIDTNVLVWKCLGYSYNAETQTWGNDKCFPKWKTKFPEPPDVIGVTRKYDPKTDKKVRDASMELMRSIPRTFKEASETFKVSVSKASSSMSSLK